MPMQTTGAEKIGVVYKKNLGHYDVHHENKIITCAPSAKLWKHLTKDSTTAVRPWCDRRSE